MLHRLSDKRSSQHIQLATLFILALVMLNVAFINSGGWTRFAWSIAGYACLLVVFQKTGLTLPAIGLSREYARRGVTYAAYTIAGILAVMLLIFVLDTAAFKDPRYNQSLSTALYAAFVLLPLKTVLFEELAFRGILPAMLLKIKHERRFAAIVSAAAFGMWHILSAAAIGSYSLAGGIIVPNILVIISVFIATSAFGYLLLELRWRSNSLVAPITVHWFINGFGIILASLSWS